MCTLVGEVNRHMSPQVYTNIPSFGSVSERYHLNGQQNTYQRNDSVLKKFSFTLSKYLMDIGIRSSFCALGSGGIQADSGGSHQSCTPLQVGAWGWCPAHPCKIILLFTDVKLQYYISSLKTTVFLKKKEEFVKEKI